MNVKNIILAMNAIEADRNVSKEIVVDALKDSLIKAYRRQIDVPDALVEVEIDENTAEMHLYHCFLVVDEVSDDELEVSLDEISEETGDLKVGDFYRIEQDIQELGRAAATLAKNVIKQKIREAEKQAIYDEYIDQLGEMIMGMIESVEDRFVVINLGKALAIMPKAAQIPTEYYKEGQTIKVVLTDVNRDTKGSQILVSRADEMLVRRLFEREVPEIFQGQVEIKAIAREAGERTKMAVYSHDQDIDPIGACIGPRGTRVQVVIEELKGEKIDIFEWSDNMIDLVRNSLAPAEVVAVFPSPSQKGLTVVVDDDQLSLAIGKKGKNARLAVRLTKQRIDIKSVSEATEDGVNYVALMAAYEAELHTIKVERELAATVTPLVEEVVEVVEAVVEQEPIIEPVTEEVVETVVESAEVPSKQIVEEPVDETATEESEEVIRRKKPLLKPRTDEYVSKFERIADGAKKQDSAPARKRYRKNEHEEEPVVNNVELLKEKEYEIQPEYSEAELEAIKDQRAAEQEAWYDDEIDFDLYDEYYDKE